MGSQEWSAGLGALRRALITTLLDLGEAPRPALVPTLAGPALRRDRAAAEAWLLAEMSLPAATDDAGHAVSTAEGDAEQQRLIALVELARGGDSEAFGELYDHYHRSVYRFLYYRVGSVPVAEDLTSDTFFRALRSMGSFRWQGKDFGAWLITIARNLSTDHFKASRTRLESPTEDMGTLDSETGGPEEEVLTLLSNESLLHAMEELPGEQRDCLVMRFLQGMSIAETAAALDRSAGATKQLQLRGVRNLARLLPEEMRPGT